MAKTILTLEHQGHRLKVKDTIGDGRCFFRAVARSLPGYTEASETKLADQIRLQACKFMEGHEGDFSPFLDETETFMTYISHMKKAHTYADDLTITALARSLKKDIIILNPVDALRQKGLHKVTRKTHQQDQDQDQVNDDTKAIVIHYNGLDRVPGRSNEAHYSSVDCGRGLCRLTQESKLNVVTSVDSRKQPVQYCRTTMNRTMPMTKAAEDETIVLAPGVISGLEKMGRDFSSACDARVANAPYLRAEAQEIKDEFKRLRVDLERKPAINSRDLQKFSDGLTQMAVSRSHSGIIDLIKILITQCLKILGIDKTKQSNEVRMTSVNIFH